MAMDGVITGCDSAVHNEYRPNGSIKSTGNLVKAIEKGDKNAII